jgi:hypothetical protein
MTSILKANSIEPEGATTTITVGETGQNVVIGADSIKNNVMKDAGGNAIFTSNGSGVLSGVNAGFGSAQVLISTTTVSTAVANISFTSGIDSTYKEYVFEYITLNPATDSVELQFQVSSDGGSSYGMNTTSTYFRAYHTPDNSAALVGYTTGRDVANSTAFVPMGFDLGNDADQAASGVLHIFNPSSTTYVKHYYGRISMQQDSDAAFDGYVGGYINVGATAINAVRFKMSSGNINAGTIKMYGIK